ncbi:MAG TPA: phosphotransferase [Methylibium sp.]|nr:phosphotransferase [Methylibium sp.]
MHERGKVLWLGGPPSSQDRQEHAQRGLTLCEVGSDALAHDAIDLMHARGLVLNAVPPHVPRVVQALGCVTAAVNHGLHVLVLLADSMAHAWVQEKLEQCVARGPARDLVRYRIAATAPEVAETFARCDPGPAINRALAIQAPDGLELTQQQVFLLRRAFHDCTLITLTPLPGGRSAMTMLVQATLANSFAGPYPLPFFAKIDRPDRILTERECYERYAKSHIAWHLRPNLQPERCLVGTELGILVGSFVMKSESLWSLITRGQARSAIDSLFDETLASWRDTRSVMSEDVGSITPELAKVFQHKNVRQRYVKAAAAQGFQREPAAIWERFLNLPTRRWPRAPVHGDLHAENVRVRRGDAIIIDLARVTMGPPSADPACLEVWIAFELPPPDVQVDESAWLSAVQELYALPLIHAPDAQKEPAPMGCLRDSILQIRRLALAKSAPAEYAITLALYLLRRAMFEPDRWAPELDFKRRTWAWILGCQLLDAIRTMESCYEEAA